MNDLYIQNCELCDICINNLFTPSRGQGRRNAILYILPNTTKTSHKKGICTTRRSTIIKDMNDKFNFNAYYTYLVKCIPNGSITQYEIDTCFEHLKKEIYIIKPRIIVTIGDTVTSKFLIYDYFKQVVDKGDVLNINGIETVVYPIHNFMKKDLNINEAYNKSFVNIAHIYKALVDKNYRI